MSGSYKLWELTRTRDEVYELAEQVVDELGLDHVREDVKTSGVFNQANWDELSQTLLYTLHRTLWEGPRRSVPGPLPFTHETVMGSPTLTDIVQKLVPQASRKYCSHVASRAATILAGNQLLRTRGPGYRRYYLIREWSAGFQPRWVSASERFLSRRDEADIQKQQKRAEQLAGPVAESVDISILKPPGADPDEILAYIRKVIPLVKRLQEENADLKAQIAAAEQTQQQGRWTEVADEIAGLINE